ncbi:potassium channel family protein [Pseudomaricurvus sp. HS19]|uniref:potassium channel family protein n=1 Tax=Pseudomaricurvus sp. HS19 TaxID=2692626 RepID=UPI00137196FB|nr:potassium channel family protein [Pseudomaricurvus sp. HS19]MYM62451.1 ion transporter [Pseudomaricurvus sp. HS19]
MDKFLLLLGLAGLSDDENSRARLCARMLEWPMLAAGFWLIALWYSGLDNPENTHLKLDFVLWSLFVLETFLLTALSDNPRLYLRRNWMNLVIIVVGLPLFIGMPSYMGFIRLLRLLIVIDLSMHMGSLLHKLLTRDSLAPTFIGSMIVVVMAGFMIAGLDPAIESASDGIWWAWVTITTVGYGDIVPSTDIGRLFAAILMVVGLGLISLLTASIAAWRVARSGASSEAEDRTRIMHLEEQLKRIEKKLDRLSEKHTPPE